MAMFTSLSFEDAQKIAAEYGLELESVHPLAAGSVNSNFRWELKDGSRVFSRIYEEQGEAGARQELDLLRALVAAGIPSALPLSKKDGTDLSFIHGKPLSVYQWIDGESLCLQRLTPLHLRKLGKILATLHAASAELPKLEPSRFGLPQLEARWAKIRQEAPRFAEDVDTIEAGFRRYTAELEQLAKPLPRGVIHGDLFRDNTLWQGDELACFLDFESASSGDLLFDYMVCVLAWCYKDEFVLENVQAFAEGYAEIRPLSEEERKSWLAVAGLVALRFATTRITDFSMRIPAGETPARDYRRFLSRLTELQSGRLDSVIIA